jgi:hypothetical protein
MIKGFSQYINEQYSQASEVVDIKYGNPSLWQKESIDRGSGLLKKCKESGIYEKWGKTIPPAQSSEEVKNSLQNLVMLGNAQTEEDKEFVKDAEMDMLGIFVKFLKLNGIDRIKKENLEGITEQINPITFGLKYLFNYPRPYQLALSFNIPLYPSQTTDACSPAYPSGHSIDSFVIAGLIGNKFPQLKEESQKLAQRISKSRQQGGIHFDFDSDFGERIAEEILDLEYLSL